MNDVYLDHLSFSLGEKELTVNEAAEQKLTTSNASVLSDAGFHKHHVCNNGTSGLDLAMKAIEPIREHAEKANAIVYSTCIPINASIGDSRRFMQTRDVKHLMDFPASHLQERLNLENAQIFGLSQQACTGLLGSIRMGRMLLQTEPLFQEILCVTSDRFPEGAMYEQSYNLISDGAAACMLSKNPGSFLVECCHAITNGALARANDDETVGTFFNYAHRCIVETLEKARLKIEDIGWIVPQNMNRSAWRILSRLLNFNFERVYFPTLPDIGHVISGDNIINLRHLMQSGKIQPGERVLLFMAGYGLNWQCTILRKT
jgi:3-oxoacyl-[acyl-carrier-protein] synthase III